MRQKLSRKIGHRRMMFRNLVTSLVLYEKIKTTKAKAKSIKGLVDKVINIAKAGNLAARRKLEAYFLDKNAVKKTFEVLVERFSDRKSGYANIYKIGARVGDGAPVVILELLPDNKSKSPQLKTDQTKKDKNIKETNLQMKNSNEGRKLPKKTKSKITVRSNDVK